MVKALVKLHKLKGKKSQLKNERNLSMYLLPYVAAFVRQAIKKNRYKRNPNMYEFRGTIVLDTQKNVYSCMCDKNFVGNSIKNYLFSRIVSRLIFHFVLTDSIGFLFSFSASTRIKTNKYNSRHHSGNTNLNVLKNCALSFDWILITKML